MSRIPQKDTKYELLVRSKLHQHGFRFRKNDSRYPGSPDIFLPKYNTAVFIHGCFWHGHKGCKYAMIPKTRTGWWKSKIQRNHEREKEQMLKDANFNVIILWECELKANFEMQMELLRENLNS